MARNSFALSWHGVAASALLLLSAHGAIAANLETAGKVPPGSRLIITGDGENADQFRVSTEQEIPDFRASAELPEFEVVPGAYIVSLRSGARLAGRRDFSDAHASFQRRAASVDINYQIREEYRDAELFYGLSLTLEDEDDVDALKDLPEVENVWPVTVIQAPKPFGFEKFDIGGPVASEYGYNTSVTRGENYKIDYNLKLAGVDHMHNNGFKGQGVKLAVLDSGVDYRHPSLGGGFGPGKKITFGRSYVNDGTGGPNDPLSTCTDGGHGTHVAGELMFRPVVSAPL
jgi:subtilisin family serine protease